MTNELLEALKLIKKECLKHENCNSCPMCNVIGECGITNGNAPPCDWTLTKREVYF